MARFTLKQLLVAIAAVAVLSMAVSRGVRGDPAGLVVIEILVALFVSVVLLAVVGGLLWCWYAVLPRNERRTPSSPFATDRLPEQLIPPSDPDAS